MSGKDTIDTLRGILDTAPAPLALSRRYDVPFPGRSDPSSAERFSSNGDKIQIHSLQILLATSHHNACAFQENELLGRLQGGILVVPATPVPAAMAVASDFPKGRAGQVPDGPRLPERRAGHPQPAPRAGVGHRP